MPPAPSAPLPLTVVVLTRNEAINLPHCLESLTGRVAEIVVVDSESADATRPIARSAGVRVVPFRWTGKPPLKKQWALETVCGAQPWTLVLDADESVPAAAWAHIDRVLGRPDAADGYFLPFRNWFGGRPLRHGRRNRKLCLFRTGRARFEPAPHVDPHWEVEGHVQPVLDGRVDSLPVLLDHHDRRPLFDYFERHNRYSEWPDPRGAETQPGLRAVFKRLFYRLPGRPLLAFVDSYLIQAGFLDGSAGFDFAMARAFYYWQIDAKRRARAHSSSDR